MKKNALLKRGLENKSWWQAKKGKRIYRILDVSRMQVDWFSKLERGSTLLVDWRKRLNLTSEEEVLKLYPYRITIDVKKSDFTEFVTELNSMPFDWTEGDVLSYGDYNKIVLMFTEEAHVMMVKLKYA